MDRTVAFLMLVLVAGLASGAECHDAYLRGGEPSKLDPMAHKALDGRYHIVDVDPAKRPYESPKPTAGGVPPAPIGNDGAPVHGYVLIAYVITVSGHAESPTIVDTTDTQLSKVAIAATETWRFDPGKVDGKPVCIVAMQEFKF